MSQLFGNESDIDDRKSKLNETVQLSDDNHYDHDDFSVVPIDYHRNIDETEPHTINQPKLNSEISIIKSNQVVKQVLQQEPACEQLPHEHKFKLFEQSHSLFNFLDQL